LLRGIDQAVFDRVVSDIFQIFLKIFFIPYGVLVKSLLPDREISLFSSAV